MWGQCVSTYIGWTADIPPFVYIFISFFHILKAQVSYSIEQKEEEEKSSSQTNYFVFSCATQPKYIICCAPTLCRHEYIYILSKVSLFSNYVVFTKPISY